MKPEDVVLDNDLTPKEKNRAIAELHEKVLKKYSGSDGKPYKMVMATRYRFGLDGKVPNPAMRDKKMEVLKPVELEYIFELNLQWYGRMGSAAWWEIDEKATHEWNAKHKEWKENKALDDEIKDEASRNIGEALTAIANVKTQTKKPQQK